MASVDSHTGRESVESIGPGDDPSGGLSGSQIDMNQVGALEIIAGLGGGSSDGSYDLVLEEAADDGSGNPDTWGAVASENVLGSLSTGVQADADVSDRAGYAGHERFVRVSVTENSAAGTPPSVFAVGVKDELGGFAF